MRMGKYQYILKYKTELDLSPDIEAVYFSGYQNVSQCVLVAETMTFCEALQEYEFKYPLHSFTRNLYVDTDLPMLFKHLTDIYYGKEFENDLADIPFKEWCLYSLEEIEEAVGTGEYIVCERCHSIIPKNKSGYINGGGYEDRPLCQSCMLHYLKKQEVC